MAESEHTIRTRNHTDAVRFAREKFLIRITISCMTQSNIPVNWSCIKMYVKKSNTNITFKVLSLRRKTAQYSHLPVFYSFSDSVSFMGNPSCTSAFPSRTCKNKIMPFTLCISKDQHNSCLEVIVVLFQLPGAFGSQGAANRP